MTCFPQLYKLTAMANLQQPHDRGRNKRERISTLLLLCRVAESRCNGGQVLNYSFRRTLLVDQTTNWKAKSFFFKDYLKCIDLSMSRVGSIYSTKTTIQSLYVSAKYISFSFSGGILWLSVCHEEALSWGWWQSVLVILKVLWKYVDKHLQRRKLKQT